ncbi:hypothetical protein Aduo_009183 [Ancylostoma duodenale]
MELLLYINQELDEHVPARLIRIRPGWKKQQEADLAVMSPDIRMIEQFAKLYRLSRLVEELARGRLDEMSLETLNHWVSRILALSTIAFNGSCGRPLTRPDLAALRPNLSAATHRSPCPACQASRHTLVQHLLNKSSAFFGCEHIPLVDFSRRNSAQP